MNTHKNNRIYYTSPTSPLPTTTTMCWNANVSLNTYIFGLFACFFAYFNNKLGFTSLLFIQSWMSMQLIEYFIWSKTYPNRLLSQIAWVFIFVQPIIGILSISNQVQNHLIIKSVSIVSYLFFFAYILFVKPWNQIDFTSVQSENGHLSWRWLKYSFIQIFIWFMFLSIKFIVNQEWILYVLLCISAAVIYALYHKTYTWGSLWCWLCNFGSLYIISTVFYDDVCIHYKK